MKLTSKIVPASEDFKANERLNLAALETVRQAAQTAAQGGGEKSRDRHVARGKNVAARSGGEPVGCRVAVSGNRRHGSA